ncbi:MULTISPECIES: hypothetical protein [Bacillus cereus group]|uniref:Uncharacterized protein n=1 Tax=Bacillus thuringiensis TaxID=1428 RepID=A0A9X6Z0W6_BACTU|nr:MULTISPECIES: hypothetical protein [Bacillus cereus group]MCU5282035.1 hypothetical protein [Bacillus cereus]MEC3274685.1 hypothetical protein [Bacillus thuringiensis]PFA84829.1 hypothetical protein CN398_32285 [Bacillus thuringiensis]PGQ64099.1 hypothetical protein COA26_24670 [Bacillus cereus]USP56111.1 hypothetical protein J2N67_006360 [Bacillus thuringiensis]
MGFGFCGGYDYNRCHNCRDNHKDDRKHKNDYNNHGNPELLQFLRTLTPGTCVVIQYDCQKPTSATFQGFQGNNVVILSDFDCFPGLARIAINKINVISVNSPDCSNFCCKRKKCKDYDDHENDYNY